MTSRYSEALEQQINLHGWLSTPFGALFSLHDFAGLFLEDEERKDFNSPKMRRIGLMQEEIVKDLLLTPTYYCSREIGDALTVAARSLPIWTASTSMLPSDRGFIWFEQPINLLDLRPEAQQFATAGLPPLQGFFWTLTLEQEAWGSKQTKQSLIFCFLLDVGAVRKAGVPRWCIIRIGEDITPGALPLNDTTWGVKQLTAGFIGALFAFLEQQVFVTHSQPLDRVAAHKARKVTALNVKETGIRVIQLRRAAHSGSYGDSDRAVDWACQWVVSGHWRRQYYPKTKTHQPRWIAPYVKGPDDKPLKAETAARVYAVVR